MRTSFSEPVFNNGLPHNNLQQARRTPLRVAPGDTIADIYYAMRTDVHVIVLTGLGKIGKSRVAVEAARRFGWLFEGGFILYLNDTSKDGRNSIYRHKEAFRNALNKALDNAESEYRIPEALRLFPALLVLDNADDLSQEVMVELAEVLGLNAHSKALITLRMVTWEMERTILQGFYKWHHIAVPPLTTVESILFLQEEMMPPHYHSSQRDPSLWNCLPSDYHPEFLGREQEVRKWYAENEIDVEEDRIPALVRLVEATGGHPALLNAVITEMKENIPWDQMLRRQKNLHDAQLRADIFGHFANLPQPVVELLQALAVFADAPTWDALEFVVTGKMPTKIKNDDLVRAGAIAKNASLVYWETDHDNTNRYHLDTLTGRYLNLYPPCRRSLIKMLLYPLPMQIYHLRHAEYYGGRCRITQ